MRNIGAKNKRRSFFLIPLILNIVFSFTIIACQEDEEEELLGNWIEKSDFEGNTRSSAVSFTIGEYAYIGLGFNGSEDEYYADFWRYDVDLNFWQQVADFPGSPRSSAVAFSIDGKGYVGTGFDGDDELGDFWVFDPASNTWEQKADFGGGVRRSAVGFSLDGFGYIGTGYDGSDLKDFWQYDPDGDSWSQIPSIGGSKRKDAVAFVIGNTAYVGTGIHNGGYESDFWALQSDRVGIEEFPWEQLEDLDYDDDYEVIREGTVAFTLNNRGYIATGNSGYVTSSVWEYTPGSDVWEEKTSFEGSSRTDAVAFTINGQAFVSIGRNGSSYYDDIWEFRPDEDYDEDD